MAWARDGVASLLHLASRHAHVDSGYFVYAALGVAAVVDTLRASVPLQKVVGKVSPFRIVRAYSLPTCVPVSVAGGRKPPFFFAL